MDEIWKDIPLYAGRYEASNIGRIRSKDYTAQRTDGKTQFFKGRIMKQQISNSGYAFLSIRYGDKHKLNLVHRLICLAFIGESSLHVNHKDGDKLNNTLDNLEYVSRRDNALHGNKKRINNLPGTTKKYRANGRPFYQAQCAHNKKKYHLGYYDTEEKAHNAYLTHIAAYGESKYAEAQAQTKGGKP